MLKKSPKLRFTKPKSSMKISKPDFSGSIAGGRMFSGLMVVVVISVTSRTELDETGEV